MASARLIRTASKRRIKIIDEPPPRPERTGSGELEPLLTYLPRERRMSMNTIWSENVLEEDYDFHPYPFSDLPIYENIWRIRKEMLETVLDPYT